MTWVETASGRRVDLMNPTPEDICPRDIAHHLAILNRFSGATHAPLSIAQHSLLVLEIAESTIRNMDLEPSISTAIRRYALLHDAHEAYKGDDSSPKKRALRNLSDGNSPISMLEIALDQAIFSRFALAWPTPKAWADIVKKADLIALATERRDLMNSKQSWPCLRGITPWPQIVKPLHWSAAEEAFHARLLQLIDAAHEVRFQTALSLKSKAA
jgi:5'-deoxynucleotidase YfbR-like HD superfamily hydrolase